MLGLISVALEYIPAVGPDGKEYPWSRPMTGVQDLLRDVADALNRQPWLNSRTAEVTFTAGQTLAVNHGLGRIPVRWAVDDVVDGYLSLQRISWDTLTITLQSENACTIVLRVA